MKVRLLKRLRRLSKREMSWWIESDSQRGRFICIQFVYGVESLKNYFETDGEALEILRRAQRHLMKSMLDDLRSVSDRCKMDKLSNILGKKL